MLLPATRRPLVITVHDLAALRYPELHPDRHVQQQRDQVRSLSRAAAVLAVSSATAEDLVAAGVPAQRIVVAPHGLTPLADPSPGPGHPPPGYLLTVGETSPRKGYPRLLEALARLYDRPRLVMAGPSAGDEARVRGLLGTLGLASAVTRLGAVSEPALAALYADALALCFPSVSEGFGLPVLEAMAAGVPVLAADIPPVREVAGDAAILLPPDDSGAWAEAIEAVTGDPSLRERMAEQGRRRAAGFTWARTAEGTLAAYRLALATASGSATS
jgi:glycosyltransferase involved in cell wall biosynthesis